MAALDFPTSPNDGDTYEGYVYNAAKGVWQWQTLTPSLVSLTDTTISSPATGEVLEYDGTSWVNAAAAAGGKILQVVSTTKTDTFSASVAAQNFVDVTGLNVSLTPSSTFSKVLITVNLNSTSARTDLAVAGFRIDRDGSAIAVGDGAGTRSRLSSAVLSNSDTLETQAGTLSIQFLDSPSTTSAVTYKVQAHNLDSATHTIHVNRSRSDSSEAFAARTVSTITVMEVAV